MKLPLQITVRNTDVAADVYDAVHAHARKLDEFYEDIMGCRVVIEVPQRHRSGTPIGFNVRIDLTVPGGELVVTRKPRLDVRTAIQDAFDAAARRLQDYARRQRGDVKQHK
jgi:ribosome-associated translation inhibitor RaiA